MMLPQPPPGVRPETIYGSKDVDIHRKTHLLQTRRHSETDSLTPCPPSTQSRHRLLRKVNSIHLGSSNIESLDDRNEDSDSEADSGADGRILRRSQSIKIMPRRKSLYRAHSCPHAGGESETTCSSIDSLSSSPLSECYLNAVRPTRPKRRTKEISQLQGDSLSPTYLSSNKMKFIDLPPRSPSSTFMRQRSGSSKTIWSSGASTSLSSTSSPRYNEEHGGSFPSYESLKENGQHQRSPTNIHGDMVESMYNSNHMPRRKRSLKIRAKSFSYTSTRNLSNSPRTTPREREEKHFFPSTETETNLASSPVKRSELHTFPQNRTRKNSTGSITKSRHRPRCVTDYSVGRYPEQPQPQRRATTHFIFKDSMFADENVASNNVKQNASKSPSLKKFATSPSSANMTRQKSTEEYCYEHDKECRTCSGECCNNQHTKEFMYEFPLWNGSPSSANKNAQDTIIEEDEDFEYREGYCGYKNDMADSEILARKFTENRGSNEGERLKKFLAPGDEPESVSEFLMSGNDRIEYVRGQVLGVGTFGVVHMGINQDTGMLLAVKQTRDESSDLQSPTQADNRMKKLSEEINVMRSLDHPNIVRYYGTQISRDTGNLEILLEFVSGGSIWSLLQQTDGQGFGETVVRKYTKHIVRGLAYLHDQDIVHRDIKGANVLISDKGVAKLSDFGCSKQLAECPSVSMMDSLKNIRGSIPWMAPEVIQQSLEFHRQASDIWSLGATIVEMASGKQPWPTLKNSIQALFLIAKTETSPPVPPTLSKLAKSFLNNCFYIDPSKRSTAAQLLNHPFLK